jgi:hypothetical protein
LDGVLGDALAAQERYAPPMATIRADPLSAHAAGGIIRHE